MPASRLSPLRPDLLKRSFWLRRQLDLFGYGPDAVESRPPIASSGAGAASVRACARQGGARAAAAVVSRLPDGNHGEIKK